MHRSHTIAVIFVDVIVVRSIFVKVLHVSSLFAVLKWDGVDRSGTVDILIRKWHCGELSYNDNGNGWPQFAGLWQW